MRALFFGTPAIAVPSLEALASIANVVGVVCQPDRPAGRGLELKAPPVKSKAAELGVPVVQPEKIRTPEFAAWVKDAEADVALVIAYGRILPKAVLEAPRRGCMNLHASILPRYRGAAPITWAIVGGEAETGISLMQMDEGMDTGPVYAVHRTPIGPDTTADELAVELGALAARVVREDLRRAVGGEIEATPQDHGAATHAPLLKKEDGRIRWDRSARQIHDHIRGMTSWPGAFTTIDGKALKVLAARVESEAAREEAPPGTVVMAGRGVVIVACGAGAIQILRAQAEGRKPLAAADLVAGRTLQTGMVLGS
ncbi:MAG TPA: methionyl-tRNA formyltransferase [Sorangium sp.]|uniref:methionyl-tRNA formyltransferase n=1 Tax=Sorangium sp. So ce1153 TaxID=3133333 RepID=UPI002BEF43F8|nr:methionyl-tRNA formyltransferase [Sorangium sp.]